MDDGKTEQPHKVATFLKQLIGWRSYAALYRCEPPHGGCEFVVVSAVEAYSGPETYIFPANANGTTKNMTEMPGSFRGACDHYTALARAGYAMRVPGYEIMNETTEKECQKDTAISAVTGPDTRE